MVPNSAVYLTDKLFPIESSQANTARRELAKQAVNDKQQAFADANKDRELSRTDWYRIGARYEMERMNAETSIKDEWNNNLVRQFQDSRLLASVSPVSLFEQVSEAVVGGGLVRLQKAWHDIQLYQMQLVEWFKGVDADDPESMHILIPNMSFSVTEKGVDFATVPQFAERRASPSERLSAARLSLLLLILYTSVAFALAFVLFLR